MSKTTWLAFSLLETVLLGRTGLAHSEPLDIYPFVFEAARTSPSSICADPCYQLRIYIEDHARNLFITGIQVDIDVMGGATVAELPVYPATNPNADSGNATYLPDPGSGIDQRIGFPWRFTAIARSPRAAYDALLVNHNAGFSSVSVVGVAQGLEFYRTSCEPAETCAIIEDAVARDRIYLGRFNITRANDLSAPGLDVRVGEIDVVGDPTLEQTLEQANGRIAFVSYPVPEPRIVLPLGAMLAALGMMRRRACQRLAPRWHHFSALRKRACSRSWRIVSQYARFRPSDG